MERNSSSNRFTPQEFADWLRSELIGRQYDLRPRGGGQTKFAEDSGIGRATVSRILSGQGATDTRVLGLLSDALHLPLPEVLVHAGIIERPDLAAAEDPGAAPRRITPEQAADQLGLTDPQARRVFLSMTETLLRESKGQ
ncbi:helix-turn-helix domain-containing protein [Streptomyces sp. NPDC085524]|uniref:helix-turn-helix domain-containing protein n=1 Tax=unclassified Streptomyces TaxID=2593676 RepID=UPI0035E0F28E